MKSIGLCKNTLVQKLLKDYFMGVFICRSGGSILYSFQVDPTINVDLISQFIAALAMFGKEKVGMIKRIIIEGIDVEMSIVAKHDLIATMFFRPNMVKDYLDEEATKAIDSFFHEFQDQIQSGRSNQQIYQGFDDSMCIYIHEYLIRIGMLDELDVCENMNSYFDSQI